MLHISGPDQRRVHLRLALKLSQVYGLPRTAQPFPQVWQLGGLHSRFLQLAEEWASLPMSVTEKLASIPYLFLCGSFSYQFLHPDTTPLLVYV